VCNGLLKGTIIPEIFNCDQASERKETILEGGNVMTELSPKIARK
jgi:hypothetical protein